MIKIETYSNKGKKLSAVTLPREYEVKENAALLAQAIHVYRDRIHNKPAYVKTRGEVNRTSAKVYRQKGTGNARHGARSAPIFVGGGKAHGPKGIKRTLNLPVKMRKLARNVAITMKAKDKKLVGVKGLTELTKTSQVSDLINNLKVNTKRLTFVIPDQITDIRKAIRNVEKVNVLNVSGLNSYNVYFSGLMIWDLSLMQTKKSTKK